MKVAAFVQPTTFWETREARSDIRHVRSGSKLQVQSIGQVEQFVATFVRAKHPGRSRDHPVVLGQYHEVREGHSIIGIEVAILPNGVSFSLEVSRRKPSDDFFTATSGAIGLCNLAV